VQKQVHDAVVWIPIIHDILVVGTNNRLKPLKAHGIYGAGLYKGLDIELAKK
jgi:peptide/nickel transport system substrate-binding protein